MIARAVSRANVTIDAGIDQPLRRLRAQQQVVDAQPCIPRPSVSHVVPERIHRRVGMQGPDRVDPALIENALKQRAAFRLKPSLA